MTDDPDSRSPEKGDEYALPDGSTEIVFLVEDGHVLTVREYESIDAFREVASRGRYVEMREDIRSLPDVEEFSDSESETGKKE